MRGDLLYPQYRGAALLGRLGKQPGGPFTGQGSGPQLLFSPILKEQPGRLFDPGRQLDSPLPAPQLSKSLDVFLA